MKKWEAGGSQGARPAMPLGPGNAHEPTTLYNGMMAPLVKYTIKGALWYQGETEAGRAQGHVYGEALDDARRKTGGARSARATSRSTGCSWPTTATPQRTATGCACRKARCKATSLRNTGVVVITDIGNPTDIHPTNKQDVGRRLAMLAQDKGASPSIASSRARATPSGSGSITRGLAVVRGGGPLKGFQIAGADGKYIAAAASIEGTTVVVSGPE